jgi:hypothetical protein
MAGSLLEIEIHVRLFLYASSPLHREQRHIKEILHFMSLQDEGFIETKVVKIYGDHKIL